MGKRYLLQYPSLLTTWGLWYNKRERIQLWITGRQIHIGMGQIADALSVPIYREYVKEEMLLPNAHIVLTLFFSGTILFGVFNAGNARGNSIDFLTKLKCKA